MHPRVHGCIATQLIALLLRTLPLPARLLLVLDDSPTKRSGPKVEGADVHHNPTPGPADQPFLYGHVWITLSLALRHPKWGPIGLPLRAMLYVRKRTMATIPRDRGWQRFVTKLQIAARLVEWIVPILKEAGKMVWIVIDGGYTKRPFLRRVFKLSGVVVIGRLRKDAALRSVPPKLKLEGKMLPVGGVESPDWARIANRLCFCLAPLQLGMFGSRASCLVVLCIAGMMGIAPGCREPTSLRGSERKNATELHTFDAGHVAQGELVSHAFSFVNQFSFPLCIADKERDIRKNCTCASVLLGQDRILPGEATHVTLRIDTGTKQGAQSAAARLVWRSEAGNQVSAVFRLRMSVSPGLTVEPPAIAFDEIEAPLGHCKEVFITALSPFSSDARHVVRGKHVAFF